MSTVLPLDDWPIEKKRLFLIVWLARLESNQHDGARLPTGG